MTAVYAALPQFWLECSTPAHFLLFFVQQFVVNKY